jgi:Uma2 family endonuclease
VDTLTIGPELNGITMTPEEYDNTPPDEWERGFRYELVRGVLIVNPPPLIQERDPNEELGYLLRRYKEDHPQGAALDRTVPEHQIVTGENRRNADRVIWCGLGRRPDPRNDVPTIAVEFVSEGRRNWLRDYVEKRDEYLAVGVREYWIINRFARTLTVYTLGADGSPTEREVPEGEIYRTGRLPGFELPLARLLAAADLWNEEG